jgi:hypothetical protein
VHLLGHLDPHEHFLLFGTVFFSGDSLGGSLVDLGMVTELQEVLNKEEHFLDRLGRVLTALRNPESVELVGETTKGVIDGHLCSDQRCIREEAGLCNENGF